MEIVATSKCNFFHGGMTGVISFISGNSPVRQEVTFHSHCNEIASI
jgi:hypothetical protein